MKYLATLFISLLLGAGEIQAQEIVISDPQNRDTVPCCSTAYGWYTLGEGQVPVYVKWWLYSMDATPTETYGGGTANSGEGVWNAELCYLPDLPPGTRMWLYVQLTYAIQVENPPHWEQHTVGAVAANLYSAPP
jgi:hypothetical protein